MYIYVDCTGDLYATETKQTAKQRRCAICGDYATFIGEANSFNEAWQVLEPYIDRWDDNMCLLCEHLNEGDEDHFSEACQDCEMFQSQAGYDYEYLADFIYHYFGNS